MWSIYIEECEERQAFQEENLSDKGSHGSDPI